MVAWLAMSMLAGIEAFILIQPKAVEAIRPLAFGGFFIGATGILFAAAFLVAGPVFNLGVQEAYAAVPRVYGLAWEANLYASFLAICAFFALEEFREHRAMAGLAMLAAILIGFPLGITRAAYVGLGVGAVAYAVARLVVERRLHDILRLAAISVALLAVGIGASMILLPNVIQRDYAPPVTGGLVASGGTVAGAPASPAPVPTFGPSTDTMAYRMERVDVAVGELPKSPLIGFGAVSFGQENPGRYNGSGPDYIAVMFVAVLYESGVVGAAALALGFALLLASLWISALRFAARRDSRGAGTAAAFFGSIVCMLVAYQATNALPYAVSWVVIGTASALAASNTSAATLRDLFRPRQSQAGQNINMDG